MRILAPPILAALILTAVAIPTSTNTARSNRKSIPHTLPPHQHTQKVRSSPPPPSCTPCSPGSNPARPHPLLAQFPQHRTPLSLSSLLSARSAHAGKTVWGLPNTRTFVSISVIRTIIGPAIPALLSGALNAIETHIRDSGDGLIPDGFWSSQSIAGLQLTAMNADNHQTTFGALGAAVNALID